MTNCSHGVTPVSDVDTHDQMFCTRWMERPCGAPARGMPVTHAGHAEAPGALCTGATTLGAVTDQQQHRFERGTDGPKVIVAGVDGSDSSWRAAAYAAGLARRQNALLALVYVQPYLPGGAPLGVPVSEVDTGIAAQL